MSVTCNVLLLTGSLIMGAMGGRLATLRAHWRGMMHATPEAMTLNGTGLADSVTLKVLRVSEAAVLPRYATDGAACFDLQAIEVPEAGVMVDREHPAVFRTGLAVEIPEDHVMLIYSRSGHGFKHDVRLANGTGVIDQDYRGELHVKLTADGAPFTVHNGDRIAQALLLPIPEVHLMETLELSTTVRGTGGYGSTGR